MSFANNFKYCPQNDTIGEVVRMKIFFGIAFILFSAADIYILLKLKKRKQKVGARATLTSFVFIFLLTLIVYIYSLKVSYLVMLLVTVSLFLDAYVGYYLNYYSKSRVMDRYQHGYGTFAFTLLFFNLITLFVEKGGSKLFQVLFVLFLGIAIGAVHEIIEFVSDLKHQSTMQKGLRDTNVDIIFNILGSSLAAGAAYLFMI